MTGTATEYKFHPAADLFQAMTDEEYQGLKADIAEHGQRAKIVKWRGKIIDGRHRLRACIDLGRDPDFEELDADQDPWAFVISHNLHRRHLTTSQRAMIASELANAKRGGDHSRAKVQNCTLADAAAKLNVSERTAKSANKVREHGSSALVDAVKSGELPVSKAADLVEAVPDKQEQTKIVGGGKSAVDEAVSKPKAATKPRQPTLPTIAAGQESVMTMHDVLKFLKGAAKNELRKLSAAVIAELESRSGMPPKKIEQQLYGYQRMVDGIDRLAKLEAGPQTAAWALLDFDDNEFAKKTLAQLTSATARWEE